MHEDDIDLERLPRTGASSRRFHGRPVRVTFAAANTRRDIRHGLDVIPDGYDIVVADAEIHATPGTLWMTSTAYLQANAANAHAILVFYVLREDPVNA